MGNITDSPSVSPAKAGCIPGGKPLSNKPAKICSPKQSLNTNEPLFSPGGFTSEIPNDKKKREVWGGGWEEKGKQEQKPHPLSKNRKT